MAKVNQSYCALLGQKFANKLSESPGEFLNFISSQGPPAEIQIPLIRVGLAISIFSKLPGDSDILPGLRNSVSEQHT